MLKSLKNVFLSAIVFIGFFFSINSFADVITCPSTDSIKSRKISQEFEWTVSEDVSLHSLLNVDRLYSVSIENYGEFMACTYESEGIRIRLDGKPITVGCLLKPQSEQWLNSGSGQYICLEAEIENCHVAIDC